MISYLRKAVFASALLLLIDIIVYFHTQAPAVQFIDSGELAVVCKTLGIAHPTGYPLYTLMGRLFCLIPLNDIIFRVSLMSLLFTCLASVILFFILLNIGESLSKEKKGYFGMGIWSALVAGLIFSFTPTLWSQATSNEVYSLNLLFYSLIILLILKWRKVGNESKAERLLLLLIFFYALSFGNHMSTILLLPAVFFILITRYGKDLFVFRRIALIFVIFLLGLSVYLFLPIRSSQNPIMNWGNPESWATFKRHVTGWQYQVWMFAQSAQELGKNLQNFIRLFFQQFPFYLLPLSFLGIWRLLVRDRTLFAFFLILFSANVIYGINYGIPDIDPYFLGAFLVNAIFVGVGILFVFQMIGGLKIKKVLAFAIMMLFILLPLVLLKKNYFQEDRSRDFFARDYASNVMRSVGKDAVILTNVWDHYSPWLYLRFVELKRPDVNYLDAELCRRTWYHDFVKVNYGDLYRRSQNEIKRFLREVQPFENRFPFNPQVIEGAYIGMFESFLDKNFSTRPLYDDLIGGPKIGGKYIRIPQGMVFSLKDSLTYYPYDFPDLELSGVLDRSIYKDERTLFNLKRYTQMIDLRLRYLTDFKREDQANDLFGRYQAILSEPIK